MRAELGNPTAAAVSTLVGSSGNGYRLYSRQFQNGAVYLNLSGITQVDHARFALQALGCQWKRHNVAFDSGRDRRIGSDRSSARTCNRRSSRRAIRNVARSGGSRPDQPEFQRHDPLHHQRHQSDDDLADLHRAVPISPAPRWSRLARTFREIIRAGRLPHPSRSPAPCRTRSSSPARTAVRRARTIR